MNWCLTMSVMLNKVEIDNFRSCKSTVVSLNSYTGLVGYNNAGKSNIILAIKWLLEGGLISETDMYDPEKPVEVKGVISGITGDTLSLLADEHTIKITPYIIDGCLYFYRTQYLDEKGKVKKEIHVNDGSKWVKNPTGIDGAISNLFPDYIHVPAMSDAVEDSTKYKSGTTIGKILLAIVSEIKKEHEDNFSRHIHEIDKYMSHDGESRLDGLIKIDEGINGKVNNLFPDVSVKLHFPTPTLEDIFKSGTLKVFESKGDENIIRDISRFGHGTQRSIQMALIQYLAEIKKNSESNHKSNTFLFIDEPELYLHPSAINAVRDSLYTLSELGYQVIVSTHSASMFSPKHAANAVQVYKNNDGTIARETISDKIKELYNNSSSQLHAAFNISNSSSFLFSEGVLLVEGKTEISVLHSLYKKIKGYEIDNGKVCIVSVDGRGSLLKMSEVIKSMGIRSRILADCDFISLLVGSDEMDVISENINDLFKAMIIEIEHGRLAIDKELSSSLSMKTLSSKDFIMLCENTETSKHIKEIHARLKELGIYIWTLGDIEKVYGFKKNQRGWDQLIECLNDENKDIVEYLSNPNEMNDFIHWI